MELKITADWVISRLCETRYIKDNAFWVTSSDDMDVETRNYWWIIKALEELGLEYREIELWKTKATSGADYQLLCFGIEFEDMEKLKDEIPETYNYYFNLRYSKEMQRKEKLNKIIKR